MRMKFLDLSLKHRYDIYSRTKKVLRKYQKGIISGKLTADKFADNMLKDISMIAYLDEIGITVTDFRDAYMEYVQTLILIQNDCLAYHKQKAPSYYSKKADYTSIFKLNTLLAECGYNLSIPAQYLTEWDVDCIERFLETGNIDIGNEKIYNYITSL